MPKFPVAMFLGDPEPPKLQRVFWSFTEGATATALLVAGGSKGLVSSDFLFYKKIKRRIDGVPKRGICKWRENKPKIIPVPESLKV